MIVWHLQINWEHRKPNYHLGSQNHSEKIHFKSESYTENWLRLISVWEIFCSHFVIWYWKVHFKICHMCDSVKYWLWNVYRQTQVSPFSKLYSLPGFLHSLDWEAAPYEIQSHIQIYRPTSCFTPRGPDTHDNPHKKGASQEAAGFLFRIKRKFLKSLNFSLLSINKQLLVYT